MLDIVDGVLVEDCDASGDLSNFIAAAFSSTPIKDEIIHDDRLTLEARAMLIIMVSQPDDIKSNHDVVRIAGGDIEKAKGIIGELVECGYINTRISSVDNIVVYTSPFANRDFCSGAYTPKLWSFYPNQHEESASIASFIQVNIKDDVRQRLTEAHGNKCSISGCDYDEKLSGARLHIHRIKKGRDGGKYTFDNCLLVCRHHHRGIEGMSRDEINK